MATNREPGATGGRKGKMRMPTRHTRVGLAAILAVTMTACSGGSGMGDEVRRDVTQRMQASQEPIAACYEAALQRDRKLRGMIVLSFVAAAKTGKFEKIEVVRNDLPDAELEQCVIAEVSKLALAKPTSTQVAIEYPLSFSPIR